MAAGIVTAIMIMGMIMTMVSGITTIITTATRMIEGIALVRLLQLASPMLPVGAYAYSQGLEAAIEAGDVRDAGTAQVWIIDMLDLSLARFDLPLLLRMIESGDADYWNEVYLAGRDTREIRAETLQMGYSLAGLSRDLGLGSDMPASVTFPLAYARAALASGIPVEAALQAHAWSWLENQVAVAMKAIPIGQVAGQRILLTVGEAIPTAVEAAMRLEDEDISSVAPGLALASCRHETQYSRLFRS